MSLTVSNLRKDYVAPDGSALRVLDIPEFAVASGEQVALIGSSGSGKTTLLHCIAGIIRPDRGQVLIRTPDGETDITALGEAQRDVFRGRYIGYVFQTHHLLPGFTALENVVLGMSFTGRKADRPWARHLLEEVGLADRLDYKPGRLSVGQQQRVAVARALASRPSLVLADEPTGALDEDNAQQVLDLIRKLCTEVNAALVLVTHDLGIANQLPRKVELAQINHAAKARKAKLAAGGVS
ncbi:MAG: ABC transporter ATP-binding protein [Tepidisphaerales bacterium]